ncbi:ATP-binding protein [Streptomyces sp. NPDC050095]|uniref:SCO6881 family protein n=1 Tax=unclassified Streptomyces TaxID=2593676 RepID=UPI0034143ADD
MSFCDLPLAGTLCTVADAADFASDPGKAIGNWIATSCGDLAATAADLAAKAVDTTTKIDLNAHWFVANYELILPIGLVLLVASFCAQLVRAALRRDGQALRQAFTGTLSGCLFAFAAIALTTVAIEVTDALSAGLFSAAGTSISATVRRLVQVSLIGSLSSLGWLVASLAALGSALGALLYWCVMVIRKVGVLVLVTLAVFVGAGGGWEATRRWRRGWIEATATLVASKLLMTIIFLLGVSALGNTKPKDGLAALSDVLAGVVIMAMVLLCPYMTYRFVHWAGEGAGGEDLHRAGGAGMTVARQHTERVGRKAASAMASGAGAGAGAAGASGSAMSSDGLLAANPTGESGSSGQGGADALRKTVTPPPTSVRDTDSQAPGWPSAAAESSADQWSPHAPAASPPPSGTSAPGTSAASSASPGPVSGPGAGPALPPPQGN